MSDQVKCELCGEPMPPGEVMFKLHGYSGPCPKPPLTKTIIQKGWIAYTKALRILQAESLGDTTAGKELTKCANNLWEHLSEHERHGCMGVTGKV